MDLKEKIDMLNEILDTIKKYPENLQEKVFDFLLNNQINTNNQEAGSDNIQQGDINDDKITTSSKKKRKKATTTTSYTNGYKPQLVKNLNLRPDNTKTLVQFFEEKCPEGNIQNSAVMTYYLEKVLNIDPITPDHIFTCYMELGKKIPAVILQNLRDCSGSRYGYIDFKDGKITTSIKGINFVTQDLPHKDKK